MSTKAEVVEQIKNKYQVFSPYLNERTRRIWAAIESTALGRGGITQVAHATGLSRTTIYAGLEELETHDADSAAHIVRHAGGGRKPICQSDTTLIEDLQQMLSSSTEGESSPLLQWTCKSASHLAKTLQQMGHQVSDRTVCTLLHELGYSLKLSRRSNEGDTQIDRDQQFRHIATVVQQFQQQKQPVISVDAKRKKLDHKKSRTPPQADGV
jgi:transposase